LLLLGTLDARVRNNVFEKANAKNGSSGRGKTEVDFPLGKGQVGEHESCLPDWTTNKQYSSTRASYHGI
jgi:hypothetical protein